MDEELFERAKDGCPWYKERHDECIVNANGDDRDICSYKRCPIMFWLEIKG